MSRRTWFITGVSSGFGRELSQQLLDRGDGVIGTVRDTSKAHDLLERYPEAFHARSQPAEIVCFAIASNARHRR